MIPSNLTLDEALKFYDLPQPVLDAIERELAQLREDSAELEETERQLGVYSTFADGVSHVIYTDATDAEKLAKITGFYENIERRLNDQ